MKRSAASTPKDGEDKAANKRQRQSDPKEAKAPEDTKEKKDAKEEPDSKSDKIPYQELLKGKNRHRLPDKIMRCLMQEIEPEVLWWSPHENGFTVDSETVQAKLLDVHFRGTKLSSLVRSLNRWGFRRDFYRTLPKRALAFQHSEFQKDAPHLLKDMKIIASTTQDLPSDSSDSEEEAKSARNTNARRSAGAKQPSTAMASPSPGIMPLSQQQARQRQGLPASPMAQTLLLSNASRLPQSLMQSHELRQTAAVGPGRGYDMMAQQLMHSRLQGAPFFGTRPLLGQPLLPASIPMGGSGPQNIGLNPLGQSAGSGLSPDLAMLRTAQMQQQQQQQLQQQGTSPAFSAYLQALRSAEGAWDPSVVGAQSPQDQLSMQARLLGAANQPVDDTLRLVQYHQGDPGAGQSLASSNFPQLPQQASLLSQRQAALLPQQQQQQLLNADLERQQVNSQIQALLQQIQSRQADRPRGGRDAPTGDGS